MQALRTLVFLAALSTVAVAPHARGEETHQHQATAQLAGTWTLSMDSPHGLIHGPFELRQNGDTLTGTYKTDIFGSLPVTGDIQAGNVTFVISVDGGDMKVTLTGAIDGNKMSGKTDLHDGDWTATR